MAGIGFELKKLFSRKGLVATIRAYGYAAMVTAGPMILGFLLLLSAMFLADLSGAPRHDRELLVSMLTHALLASPDGHLPVFHADHPLLRRYDL